MVVYLYRPHKHRDRRTGRYKRIYYTPRVDCLVDITSATGNICDTDMDRNGPNYGKASGLDVAKFFTEGCNRVVA